MKCVREGRRLTLPDSTTERAFGQGLPSTDNRMIAVVGGAVRQKMDAAIGDMNFLVHVETVGEALQQVRETPTSVLLLSPHILRPGETTLLVRCLSTAAHAVALLDEESQDPTLLLRLGACGLKDVIDLRKCEGWNDLRRLLAEGIDPVAGRVAAIVLHHLDDAAPGTKRFFARMIYDARSNRTVNTIANRLGIIPSTLMSRFHRARLPSPKTLLSATRIVFAKALLEESRFSISAVANQLQYSSAQAFGRQVWQKLGMSAGELRRTVSFAQVMEHYLEEHIVRHQSTYRTFDPFASFGGHCAIVPDDANRSNLYH